MPRPTIIGERQTRIDRRGSQRNGSFEGRGGGIERAVLEPQGTEGIPSRRARHIQRDGFFDLRDRVTQVLEPGERVAERDVCLDISRIAFDRRLRTRLGGFEFAAADEQRGGFHLRIDVRRIEVGGTVRLIRMHRIVERHIDAGALVVRLRPSSRRQVDKRSTTMPSMGDSILTLLRS